MRKKENKAINEIKNLESRIESLPELENSSNRIAKKFYKTKRKRILTKKNVSLIMLLISIFTIILVSFFIKSKEVKNYSTVGPENLRAMNYEQFVDGDDKVYIAGTEGTDDEQIVDNIKFSTFFLRDLDSDGYAEKLKGTCKEIGKEDTLYMEIIVQTAGYLKDGKIEINGNNFYLQTALPKDNELKANYIGNNIKQIEFENLNNGTQKLLTGVVCSGDYRYTSKIAEAIGNNINNYSRQDNKVIFTGKYVDENEVEHAISKEITLEMDWYGTTRTTISSTYQNYKDLDNRVNEENRYIEFNFKLITEEKEQELLISKNNIEATIPEFNGYGPISVEVINSNANYNYDSENSKLTIERTAVVDETGKITSALLRTNTYNISVKYPIEAYEDFGGESVELLVPVEAYYEGYNNPNTEFINPYKSNVAKTVVRAVYKKYVPTTGTEIRDSVSLMIGNHVSNPYNNYIISKIKPMKIYNGVSSEETDDTYIVRWNYYRGNIDSEDKIVLKETPNGELQVVDEFSNTDAQYLSMDELTTNKGIYFNDLSGIINDDGKIKVYDEETGNLLLTIDNTNLNKYTSNNPFVYETPIKHVKVEVIGMNEERSLYVYNIKELDDEYITNNYTLEEFTNLKQIKSNLAAYRGEVLVGSISKNALYEIPTSIARISLSKNILSTQVTEKNENIKITAEYNQSKNEAGWKNGTFLVKLPDEILDTKINSVTVNNSQIEIVSYEYTENEQGKFIKIFTSNENPADFIININCNITPDPRVATVNKTIELYAINEEITDYYYKGQDTYDANGNLNVNEMVNKQTVGISLIAPNSLLTNQTASEFDETGAIIVSPNIAELKPIYGDNDREKQTVKIGVQMKNNYTSTISEVKILGKIPFEGDTYVLSENNLNSEFSTNMTNAGIEIPEELQGKVTIYYSENETPNKELDDEENGWKLKTNVTDWSKIKTYLIDFENTVIDKGAGYTFYYTIEIPFGVELNQTAYSHHGIYFCLDTTEGKYRTKTEPNKIGIRIAEKYNLTLAKYQRGIEKLIPGATYKVSKLNETGNIEESKTAVTNASGLIEMDNLYAEKVYTIEEIQSPTGYELNSDVVKIIGHINQTTGVLTVEKLEGVTRGNIITTKNEGEDYKARVNVEDEVNAKLHITKLEQGTDTKIHGVKFKITGEGLSAGGIVVTTNTNGEIDLNGLKIGEEYTITETKAEGYYLGNPIKFKIVNNEGTYEVQIIDGTVKTSTVSISDDIPTANLELENEKIPTYDLQINKIAKGSITEQNSTGTPIVGAKFKLYKERKVIGTYETNAEGHININGLYQYEESKDINQTYKLVEIFAPEGYAKTQDLVFTVSNVFGVVNYQETLKENQEPRDYNVDGTNVIVTVEDSPSFMLTKKDGETDELLPNTKFAIYDIENGENPAKNSKGEILGTKETINGKEYYTLTTNESGQIIADLSEGLYKAVEVEADEKYDIKGNEEYFGIGKSREGKKETIEEWGDIIGGSRLDYVYSVTNSADGSYLVGGKFFSDFLQLGSLTITNHGNSDGMIIKYSSEGEVEWAESIGGTGNDAIYSVIATEDGGYLIGGSLFSDDVQVGNQTIINHGNRDGMIVKYNREGEVEWAESVGGTDYDYITSVIETEDEGFLVIGHIDSDNIQIGDNILTDNGGIIIKYSREGEVEWVESISGLDITSVTETQNGGCLIGGHFSSNIQVGNTVYTNNGNNDGMVIKYSQEGEVEWADSIEGTGYESIETVIATEDGEYILGGYFTSDSINVGNQVLESNGVQTGFILKYNSNGIIDWAESINRSETINSITVTEDGGFLIGGRYFGNFLQVGNQTITNHGNYDGMIIKYSKECEVEWAESIGGPEYDSIESVIATKDGEYLLGGTSGLASGFVIKLKEIQTHKLFVKTAQSIGESDTDKINTVIATEDGGYLAIGEFASNTLQIENHILENHGSNDAIIIKYDKFSKVEWTDVVGGTDFDCINSAVATKDGGYIVGGCFYSDNIQVGNQTLTNNGFGDGIIIKYSSEGEVKWTKTVGGSEFDSIVSVTATEDGGCFAGGIFEIDNIQVGNQILTNHGNNDGMVIKYSDEGEVEWAETIGGIGSEDIRSVTATEDSGYLVVGIFLSDTIQIGNQTLTNHGYYPHGMIIKYSREGQVEWAETIGEGDCNIEINSVTVAKDEGFCVVGYFAGENLRIGNQTIEHQGGADGMIIKYNREGKVEWAEGIGGIDYENISSVTATEDGGFLVGGTISSKTLQIGDKTLRNNGYDDGIVIKYSAEGEVEWAEVVGGTSFDFIDSVTETKDGYYLLAGSFSSSALQIDNQTLINLEDNSSDGMVIKFNVHMGAKEQEKVIVENYRKEYTITTDVREIDGIKGGTVSGEDNISYEKVKHGDNNTKEIVMIPDDNYEIIEITVNGEDWTFEANQDGTYTMPQFENVTENKHIVVTFSLKDNKIIINKADSVTGEKLKGAKFKLDQIEERTEPINSDILGELHDNGETYNFIDKDNEITGVLGNFANNGYYRFVEQDGVYVPTNSRTYQLANGGTTGYSATASSYIPINLSELDGKYKVVVNAYVSSRSGYDYGFATITQSTTTPAYNNSTGRFISISGTSISVSTPKDYESTVIMEGGQTYYLHLGYRKSSTSYSGEDQFVVNSIKVYPANDVQYNFIKTDSGKYESTNQGMKNTVCNSYVTIDLRTYEGKYNLTVNAEVSGQTNSDFGFVTITEDENRPMYNNSTGRLLLISGERQSQDYETILEGGKLYYLHMGYHKYSSSNSGNDKFTINSISLSLNNSDLYYTTAESNSSGQAITQIPFGKYAIKEIKAPDGYVLNEIPTVIEFRNGENAPHEFTISNDKLCNVIVHHYKKEADGTLTTTKLADDEKVQGLQGENYTTQPNLNIENYELEKDQEGEYILPENKIGTFTYEDKEVIYYYIPKSIPLTVHHYVEGTNTPVLLVDGEDAEDIEKRGNEGEEYTTEPLSEDELNEKYELVEVPQNAEGTYEYDENIVTYYYRVKRFKVATSVKLIEKTDELGQLLSIKGGTISGEDEETYEIIEYGEDSIKEIKAVPDNGYEVESITINDEPVEYNVEPDGSVILNKFIGMKSDKNVVVSFGPIQGKVKVNHFIEGTEERITDLDGNIVPQEVKTGELGTRYAVQERIDLLDKYEVVRRPAESSGEYSSEEKEYNYYYRIKKYPYVVNYLLKDDDDDDTNNTVLHEQKSDGIEYDYGTIINSEDEIIAIDGYDYDSVNVENLKITKENNVINVYYTEDIAIGVVTKDLKYTVEYYKGDEKQEEDTIEKTKTVEIAEPDTLEVNKDEINIKNKYEHYVLDKIMLNDIEIDELPDTVNDNDIIKVIYKKAGYKYTVEYYFENVLDEDLTEEETAEYGEIITDYIDKVKDGYRLKEEPLPIEITEDENNNIMKVYYVIDDSSTKEVSYKVEYYKDGEEVITDRIIKTITIPVEEPDTLEVDKTEINTENKYEHYVLDKLMLNDGTEDTEIDEIPDEINDNDIIKVFYKKAGYKYTVEYYFEDVLDETLTEENEAEYGEIITDYIDKVKDGYRLKEEVLPIEITEDENNNIMKVYYVIDDNTTKEVSYKVEYFKDGEEVITDRIIKTITIPVDNPDTLEVDKTEINTVDKYEHYVLDKIMLNDGTEDTEIDVLPDEVNDNDIIKVFYKKAVHKYTVEYYFEDVLDESLTEENEAEYGETISDYIDKVKDGYKLKEEVEPIEITEDENTNIMKVYYIIDEGETKEIKYTVEFYKDDVKVDSDGFERILPVQILKPDTLNVNKTEINTVDKYENYVLDKIMLNDEVITKLPDTVNNNDIIKVFYKRVLAKVIVNHIDKDTGETIVAEEKNGYVGDDYRVEEKTIEGYKLIEEEKPTNTSGKMTEEDIVINYYYKKVKENQNTSNEEQSTNTTNKPTNTENKDNTNTNPKTTEIKVDVSSQTSNSTGNNNQTIIKTSTNGNQNTESTNTITDSKTQVIKSGDIIPVIAISTILALLMINIVIARKRNNLD